MNPLAICQHPCAHIRKTNQQELWFSDFHVDHDDFHAHDLCTDGARDPPTDKLQARQPDQTGDSVLQFTSSFGREGEGHAVGILEQISPHLVIEALSRRHIMLTLTANFVIYQVQLA